MTEELIERDPNKLRVSFVGNLPVKAVIQGVEFVPATEAQSLSARVVELEGVAGALIAKLDECAPHIANAFAMEHFRDRPYSGPQYRDELNALRSALTKEAVVDG